MDVDAQLARSARLSRGWTQQHLADACDLSLRTVQRVERFGSAAPETVMELCSVLELSQTALVVPEAQQSVNRRAMSPGLVVTLMISMLLLGVGLGVSAMTLLS